MSFTILLILFVLEETTTLAFLNWKVDYWGLHQLSLVAELWAEQIRVFEGVKKDKIFGMDEAVIVGGCFPILLEFFGSSKSFKNVERFCYSGGVSSIFWFRFVGRGRGRVRPRLLGKTGGGERGKTWFFILFFILGFLIYFIQD